MAQRASRKRRKQRQRAARQTTAGGERAGATAPSKESSADFMTRGYARGRAKDEEARARLEPLAPGERPTAVTVAFWVAVIAVVANVVALVVNFDPDDGPKTTFTLLACAVLAVMAYGLWRARYWAALGMQTLLALTVILAAIGLIGAVSVGAAVLLLAIVAGAGTLFWFLIKAMARLQMPPRPGAR